MSVPPHLTHLNESGFWVAVQVGEGRRNDAVKGHGGKM